MGLITVYFLFILFHLYSYDCNIYIFGHDILVLLHMQSKALIAKSILNLHNPFQHKYISLYKKTVNLQYTAIVYITERQSEY